jgi:hypothetical protein
VPAIRSNPRGRYHTDKIRGDSLPSGQTSRHWASESRGPTAGSCLNLPSGITVLTARELARAAFGSPRLQYTEKNGIKTAAPDSESSQQVALIHAPGIAADLIRESPRKRHLSPPWVPSTQFLQNARVTLLTTYTASPEGNPPYPPLPEAALTIATMPAFRASNSRGCATRLANL